MKQTKYRYFRAILVEGIAELLHDALEYCDNAEDLARINDLIRLTNKLYSSLI